MGKENDKIRPIKPEEAAKEKLLNIPNEMTIVVNELLTEKVENGCATILEKEIVEKLVERGFDANEIYEKGWLNFEPIYREFGWEVTYDKPGFNEKYPAKFRFKVKTKITTN